MVAETDGIVFCLSKPVQKRMKQLNYNNNIYGWGIEHFFNACAAAQGLYSVVDKLQLVQHPPERGYPGQNAAETRKIFLSQMSSDEKRQHQLLMSIIKKKKRKKKYIKQINHLKRFMTQFYQTWRKKYGTL
jgi:hypothetical protein